MILTDILRLSLNEKENRNKWEKTGLLEGLDEETAKNVAVEFTKIGKYLLATEGEYMKSVTLCAFPTIREVYRKNGGPTEKYSPKALCDELNKRLKDAANIEAVENNGTDYEVEVSIAVSKYFSKNTLQ